MEEGGTFIRCRGITGQGVATDVTMKIKCLLERRRR